MVAERLRVFPLVYKLYRQLHYPEKPLIAAQHVIATDLFPP